MRRRRFPRDRVSRQRRAQPVPIRGPLVTAYSAICSRDALLPLLTWRGNGDMERVDREEASCRRFVADRSPLILRLLRQKRSVAGPSASGPVLDLWTRPLAIDFPRGGPRGTVQDARPVQVASQ